MISIIIVVIIASICGLSFFYFFHRSVRFDSDYGIDVVTITEESSGKTISKHSESFSHKAGYGKYRYEFVANKLYLESENDSKANKISQETAELILASADKNDSESIYKLFS